MCSRAGNFKNATIDNLNVQRKRRTESSKCNCPTKLITESMDGNGFLVKTLVEKHNHSFTGKGGMQFLRCSKSLTKFHKIFIMDAAKLNIGVTRAYAILKSMLGSYENMGATVVNFKKISRDIKNILESMMLI